MQEYSEKYIVKQVHDSIDRELARIGLLNRVFSRGKTEQSLLSKFEKGNGKYTIDGKKIQDLIGVRVTTYFPDDIEIAINAIKRIYEYDSESSTIDSHESKIFDAVRCNLIFKLPETLSDQSDLLKRNKWIDSTFEVQFRTVLSEGWHEVEHDLRYKCKDDWKDHGDLARALNGIFASLETSDWGMMKIFDELAYRHYKRKEWPQMLRTKLRLRAGNELNGDLVSLMNEDLELSKQIFRIKRIDLMNKLLENRIIMPITLDNILYFANHFQLFDSRIAAMIPYPISSQLKNIKAT